MAARMAQTRSKASASRMRPSSGLSVAPSRITMLPRSTRPTGRQHAIATAMASPPRSRTPSIGRLASQRMRPSASVMPASAMRAMRPTTESARVAASVRRSSAVSIEAFLLLAAFLVELDDQRLVHLGVARALGGPRLDHRLERGLRRLLVGGVGEHHLALRIALQLLHQRR